MIGMHRNLLTPVAHSRSLYARVAVALVFSACATDASNVISVEPTPTPGVVTFQLADRSLVYGLSVTTCNGRAMWTISNQRLGEPPFRITYGLAPDGFVAHTGPRALTPGCYKVIVSGPSSARFHIGADGRLIPVPKDTTL